MRLTARRNICAACLKTKGILSFSQDFVPRLETCFYCRQMNTDGFHITLEDLEHAQKANRKEKQTRQEA